VQSEAELSSWPRERREAPDNNQVLRLPMQLTHPLRKPPRSEVNFTNLQSLVEALRQQIEPVEPGEFHSESHVAYITQLLKDVRINPREWQQYATFRRGRYTRTLVGFDSKFVALLLCWERSQRSPIHDHAGASCWVKMLSGSLQEVQFDRDTHGKLHENNVRLFGANDVSYMNDTLGVHQIINPSNKDTAVSLHIYAPPFKQCNIFQPVSGEAKAVSMVQPFSFEPTSAEDDELYPLFFKAPRDSPRPNDPPPPKLTGQSTSLTLLELVSTLRQLRHAFDTPFNPLLGLNGIHDQVAVSNANRPVELALLRQALDRLSLSQACLNRYASPTHFSEFRYTRNLVYLCDQFSLMILCWGPGQATPIHTHGVQVKSWFKVMHGELELTKFKANPTSREPVISEVLPLTPKTGLVEEDSSFRLHKLSNPSADQPAISVHLYSPPLKDLMYNESGIDRKLPVVNYGHIYENELPGNTASDGHSSRNDFDTGYRGPRSTVTAKGIHDGASVSIAKPADARKTEWPLPMHIPLRGSVFMNFESFRELLDLEFQSTSGQLTPSLEAKLTHMLKVMNFNPMEWQGNASWDSEHFTRVLLAQTEQYSLILTCWDRAQHSPPHDHAGSRSWIKVLQGSIEEVQYEFNDPADRSRGLRVSRRGSMTTDSLHFLGRNTMHGCINESDEPAYTLHLYSPPYTRANFFEVETGRQTPVDIPIVYGEKSSTGSEDTVA